jgi:hypothetical protein
LVLSGVNDSSKSGTNWCNCVDIPQTKKSLNRGIMRKITTGRFLYVPSAYWIAVITMSPFVILG